MFQFPVSDGKLSDVSAAIPFLSSICHLVEASEILRDQRAAFHGRSQQSPTDTWAQGFGRLQEAISVQVMSAHNAAFETSSAPKPMLLQKGQTLNSDFQPTKLKQLRTPQCQKLSQPLPTLMTTSRAQEKLRVQMRTCSQTQDSKQRSKGDALMPACK